MIYHETEHGVLYCGDCLDILPTLDVKADMILCDLPYGTTACKWDVIIPFEPLWEQYKRIIKDNGAIVLTASQPFTSALVMSNTKMFKYEWIWEKQRASNFATAKSQPMKYHENICVFYGSSPTYNPQMIERQSNRVGQAHKVGYIGISKNRGELNSLKTIDVDFNKYDSDTKLPSSILRINAVQSNSIEKTIGQHPTQKPVALFEYLIKTYTNEGDLVLDNCAGSGTTAIAAIRYNRRYILIEKEEKYCQIAKQRIVKELDQLRIEF